VCVSMYYLILHLSVSINPSLIFMMLYKEKGLRSGYLHSGVKPIERLRVLRSLRQGSPASAAALNAVKKKKEEEEEEQQQIKAKEQNQDNIVKKTNEISQNSIKEEQEVITENHSGSSRGGIDVLVGVNLLREGLNLPEVSLVAILDADKEGFLRSDTALIQTIGRATRHMKGEAIFYADKYTKAMKSAIDETNRRRIKQINHNFKENMTPTTPEYDFPPDQILALADQNNENQDHFISSSSLSSVDGIRAQLSQAILSASYEGEANEIALKIKKQSQENMLIASNERNFKNAVQWRDLRDAAEAAVVLVGN